MIDLDEHHSVRPDLVLGIKPMFMPGEPGGPWVENPDRCQVLIRDHWIPIRRGVPAVRALLRDAVDAAKPPVRVDEDLSDLFDDGGWTSVAAQQQET